MSSGGINGPGQTYNNQFVKVKLGGQTYHVQLSEQESKDRLEAKARATTLHKETARRRKSIEQRKQTHEQREEQHRQKVLAARRAAIMLTTQRYLRHTSRRPIPPSTAKPNSHVNTSDRNGPPRPYSALQYPSGTTSARSDNGEIDSVLKQIRAGSSNITVPTKPNKPKITRIFNKDSRIEYVPQPPDRDKSREIFSARPMSAFDNFSTKDYNRGQEMFKMSVSNLNKEIQSFVQDSREVREEAQEREDSKLQKPTLNLAWQSKNPATSALSAQQLPIKAEQPLQLRTSTGLPNFASGDSNQSKLKPIAPVQPIQRKPTEIELIKQNASQVQQTKVSVVQPALPNSIESSVSDHGDHKDLMTTQSLLDVQTKVGRPEKQNTPTAFFNQKNTIPNPSPRALEHPLKSPITSPKSRYEKSVVSVKIPVLQSSSGTSNHYNTLNESLASLTTSEDDLDDQFDRTLTGLDDDEGLIRDVDGPSYEESYETEMKPRGILRSQSALSRSDMKDSIDLARQRVQSAGPMGRKRSIRWNSDLEFNDGSKKPMPKTPGFVNPAAHHQQSVQNRGGSDRNEVTISTRNGIRLSQPQPPRRTTWNESQNLNSNSNTRRRSTGGEAGSQHAPIATQVHQQTGGGLGGNQPATKSRIIQEAIERGYAQQHMARKQYQKQNSTARPTSGRSHNPLGSETKTSSFQRLVRPTQQQPALPVTPLLSSKNQTSSMASNMNNLDPRRTPTDQDIVQLWQTMRNVLNYNSNGVEEVNGSQNSGRSNSSNSNNSTAFMPRPPAPGGFSRAQTVNFGSSRPKNSNNNNNNVQNPTSLSIEEQRLVQSLDRLNSRLYEIESSSGSSRREARF